MTKRMKIALLACGLAPFAIVFFIGILYKISWLFFGNPGAIVFMIIFGMTTFGFLMFLSEWTGFDKFLEWLCEDGK